MDADCQVRRRDFDFSQREKRWSMNSQRLEEIVAELMKPIADARRSFDTDLSALLEEYLTEAGLHALDAAEEAPAPAVNFAELALVLQHSASLYGRKVDLLYQRVLDVSDDLLHSTQEIANTTNEEPATPSGRRKRRASCAAGFERVSLAGAGAGGARREPAAPRPPPTLPRRYVELEPRALSDCDAPLTDYDGEPIGLLADFHVAWRLQDGILVDELEGSGASSSGSLRPIPLAELSAAIAAAAPPDPPPGPPRCSTPLEPRSPAHDHFNDTLDSAIELTPVLKPERKRKCEAKVEDVGRVKILISKALRRELSTVREFSVAHEWLSAVVGARKRRILSMRHEHRKTRDKEAIEFRGFDCSTACGAGGFLGWSDAECPPARREPESDDDGFFEQSSLGDSDGHDAAPQCEAESESWSDWQRGVLQRAGAAREDAARAAARVLRALPAPPARARFPAVLAAARAARTDVPGLFLATLFLANSGNVEVIQGPPLSLNSFSVRLLSLDQGRLAAATAAALADAAAGPS